tara:strand:+ start:797 stop:1606 length:810 start_codon:yes stop_codon:yes gene_type:complete
MKNLIKNFQRDGYIILNILGKNGALSLLNEINRYYISIGKKNKIPIKNLKNYHKLNISEKKNKFLMHPNTRQIKIQRNLVEKILKNESIRTICENLYGNKKINIFQEYQNRLRTKHMGIRIVKPNSPVSGVHAESNSSPGWDPVTLWCPLVGLDKKYTLRISPKSHKKKHPLNQIVKDKKYLAKAYSKKYLKKFKFHRPNMKVGQAIVFHPNLLHGGSSCKGTSCRVSVEIRIMREEHFVKKKNYYILPNKSKRKIRLSNKYLNKKYYN